MKFEYLGKGNPEYCERVLRALPDWFGIESATLEYIKISRELPMIVASNEDGIAGFVSLKHHSPFTAEVYVMGVVPEHHRNGIGRRLLNEAEKILATKGTEFLQVKTVSADRSCAFYDKTRLFYQSYGFKEVEVFPTLWDEFNPCLLLIKTIPSA